MNKKPMIACSRSSSRAACNSFPSWIDLPRDVTANILQRLGQEEILDSAERVCTTWRSVCRDPSLWRVIHMELSHKPRLVLDRYYRHAVDRSQGELINISFMDFGTDDLLRYVSQRSRHLKILNLDSCYPMSPQGLTLAVKSFPSLEELHISFMESILAPDIETIGVSCPMLVSFTFNLTTTVVYCNGYTEFPRPDIIDNSRALSIAKTMPNLLHLCLVGDQMDNEGLLAILDCCSKLKSLDIRFCFGVDFRYDLARRCAHQIKELKRPRGKFDDGFLNPAEKVKSSTIIMDWCFSFNDFEGSHFLWSSKKFCRDSVEFM